MALALCTATLTYVGFVAVISLVVPLMYGTQVDAQVIGYIVRILIGEASYVLVAHLYFLPYALFGAAFAKMFHNMNGKLDVNDGLPNDRNSFFTATHIFQNAMLCTTLLIMLRLGCMDIRALKHGSMGCL